LVAGVALTVRCAVLLEFTSSPWFHLPLVDEEAYDRLARQWLQGTKLHAGYFWQSIFYPFALSVVYRFGSVAAARWFQALLGVLTAVLTYLLGRRIGGNGTGTIAGLMVALYGPLVFAETQLVATGWEVFWGVSLLLSLLWMLDEPKALRIAIYSGAGALSILTRATFLPFVIIATAYAAIVIARQATDRDRARWRLLIGAVVFAAILLPVAWSNYRTAESFSVLPRSSGINLYIGNNLDVRSTLNIRPGQEWERLGRLPRRHGAQTPKESQQFFLRRFRQYVWENPGHFVFGLGQKALQFVVSTEIPRNVDMYEYRRYSRTFGVLTQKHGNLGFPFAVIFALAIVGFVFAGNRIPPPVVLFLVLVPAAVVLVFVTARYRMVVVPPLCVVAALGAQQIYKRWWTPRFWSAGGVLVGGLFLTCVPNPLALTKRDWGSEMLTYAAIKHIEQGRGDAAEPLLRDALKQDSSNVVAHTVLGTLYLMQKRHPEAESEFVTALRIDPGYADAHLRYADLLLGRGQTDDALTHYQRGLALEPGNLPALNNVGAIFRDRGELEHAASYFRRVVAINPGFVVGHRNLGLVLQRMGNTAEAEPHLSRAHAAAPSPLTAIALARIHMDSQHPSLYDVGQAVRLAEYACDRTQTSDLNSIQTLVDAYRLQGKLDQAQTLLDRCLTVATRTGNRALGSGCREQAAALGR
jgi:Tfp pilus assembly protein PilF